MCTFLSFAGTMFVFILFVRTSLLFSSRCHCACSHIIVVVKSLRSFELSVRPTCVPIYSYTRYLRPLIATKIKICRYNDLASIRLIHSTQHSTEHNALFHHTRTPCVWLHIHNFKLSFLDFCFNFENFCSLLLLLIHFISALSRTSSPLLLFSYSYKWFAFYIRRVSC